VSALAQVGQLILAHEVRMPDDREVVGIEDLGIDLEQATPCHDVFDGPQPGTHQVGDVGVGVEEASTVVHADQRSTHDIVMSGQALVALCADHESPPRFLREKRAQR
jgi:hypothetical protein